MKQGQSHHTYNDNLDPEQGHNHAKFERSRYNSVREKGNVKGIFSFPFLKIYISNEKMLIISLEHVRKSKIIFIST